MTQTLGQSRLRAITIEISDPGPLLDYLHEDRPCAAFLRANEGFVALGEAEVFETDSALAGDVWWNEVAGEIEHETELPGVFGTGPLAIGSFLFDPDHSSDRSVLIVPNLIIGRRDGICWLTSIGTSPKAELPKLGQPFHKPTNVQFNEGPIKSADWEQLVTEVIKLIKQGEADKVVLARDCFASSDTPFDLRYLAHRLSETYPTTWTYLIRGLVGASPELLVRLRGGLITSRVLAGTMCRYDQNANDTQLANYLVQSPKNLLEHEFAVDSVANALELYCSGMHIPEAPFILALPNVLHLATDITGVAYPDNSALALAGALHPSAAVCGTPTPVAAELIAEFENLDRGRYTGPVGWVDAAGNGEWAIALRGGQLVNDYELELFSGAGLIADSIASEELVETSAKFIPMKNALTS